MRIVAATAAAAALFHYAGVEDLLGKSVTALIPKDSIHRKNHSAYVNNVRTRREGRERRA